MSQSHHPVARALLKGLMLLCLILAALLVVPIAIGIVAGAQALYFGGQFMGDDMLIALGALLGVALLAGILLSISRPRQLARNCGSARGPGWRLTLVALGIACMMAAVAVPVFLKPLRNTPNWRIGDVETLSGDALREQGIEVRVDPTTVATTTHVWTPMYPKVILIFGTAIFVTLTGVVIGPMLLHGRRLRQARQEHDYGHPERHGAVNVLPAAPPAELTFHQCAMKIQFKLTHLEEKVNDLETVLMRRAADFD